MIHNKSVDNELSHDVVKLAAYTLLVTCCLRAAGEVGRMVLTNELGKLNIINTLIDSLLFLRGGTVEQDLDEAGMEEEGNLEAQLEAAWDNVVTWDDLFNFDRQVEPDEFFELLLDSTRKAMLSLQNKVNSSENRLRNSWLSELTRLKNMDYEANVDRIRILEKNLNDASEKLIQDKLQNFVKNDLLNSEKMTPRFLRIAETRQGGSLGNIRGNAGEIFDGEVQRNEYITNFYTELYTVPLTAPVDFTNCVINFLGNNISNHPVVRGCILTEAERLSLEGDITMEELDEAVESCNMRSAPGIDGVSNKFIKKFWYLFRGPLHHYALTCVNKGRMTDTFSTALIRLIPKKGDTTLIKNWRPISLLSCFYKIISRVVNNRLETVIDKVTSMAQKAYNSNRFIHEALINTIDTIRHCEVNQISGVILSIDQKKAFDSVYHGYMREVYKFFNFGENFIKLMETIGTGRRARVILNDGSFSRNIELMRGFAQGNSPSPRKYNIGEQILIFKLEFDPTIASVYLSQLIPSEVRDGILHFPEKEAAITAGLKVADELVHTNRKTNAFADDTSCGLMRDSVNLARVKAILADFGTISGLETNVDKTTLMPIGNLHIGLDEETVGLGFQVVTEMKCLGIKLDNTCTNLVEHYESTIAKLRSLVRLWERFNLSLPGRINISKTFLISQVGYPATIITPTDQQFIIMQGLVDGFVTNGIVVARDRYYTPPKYGGLGLIELKSYVAALQCSWIKRCNKSINDTWRWTLAASCNFNMEFLRKGDVDRNLHPVLCDIIDSVFSLQLKFWSRNENFLNAPLIDNYFFMRAEPQRRAPVRGCVDRNLLGAAFYDENRGALRKLRLNVIVRNGNRIASFNELIAMTGLPFSFNSYLGLATAARFAIKKYSMKNGSNGSTVPLNFILQGVKKGSKRFRKLLMNLNLAGLDISKLRVVRTFFELINCTVPSNSLLETLFSCWNWSFLSNRIRTFSFQFFNNSLGVGARIAARYRNGGMNIDQRCTFCVKQGMAVPYREDFNHIFLYCPALTNVREIFFQELVTGQLNDDERRLVITTGLVPNASGIDCVFNILTSLLFNYIVWQGKIKKSPPSPATICYEIDNLYNVSMQVNRKLREAASLSNTLICRRWRGERQGRG